jgi:hypothetical protein
VRPWIRTRRADAGVPGHDRDRWPPAPQDPARRNRPPRPTSGVPLAGRFGRNVGMIGPGSPRKPGENR